MDVDLIQQCSDSALKPAVIEQFIDQAGATDPLAITVKSGGRLIFVPRPKSASEAMAIVRQYAGQAVVRVGITQYPAGLGVTDVLAIDDSLVDPCVNLRNGTAMFAKIMRIVARSYGNLNEEDTLPRVFDDAIVAYQTGEYRGLGVFQADDPRSEKGARLEQSRQAVPDSASPVLVEPDAVEPPPGSDGDQSGVDRTEDAGMRVDLTRIGIVHP